MSSACCLQETKRICFVGPLRGRLEPKSCPLIGRSRGWYMSDQETGLLVAAWVDLESRGFCVVCAKKLGDGSVW